MTTMPSKRSRIRRWFTTLNKMWLGTLTLAVLSAAVVGTVVIGKLPIGKTGYEAEFAQAAQIRKGDRATVAGITVGEVDGLRLAGDRVIVSFHVQNDVHLGAETRAAIKLTTILGSRYLELTPAGSGALPQHRIGLESTAVPYDLQKTLQDATATFDQVDADRVAQSLTVLATNMGGVPEALPQALVNIKSLSSIVSARRDQLGSLLRATDSVTSLMRNQQANLGTLVLQGRDLLAEVAARRAALERLFASATSLVHRIDSMLDDQPVIDQLMTDIHDLALMLGKNDALIRNVFQALPVTVRNVTNAFGNGNAVDVNDPAGPFIDSWMCAISGRAKQFGLTQYFQDCQPSPDPWPGWPPPQPERVP